MRSASGSNSVRRSEGREAPSMPSSSPRCTAQTSSRCSSSRSRKGQSRSEISTVFALRRRNRGSKPGLGERLLEHREVGAGRAAGARARDAPPDQVRAPLARDGLARARAVACRRSAPRGSRRAAGSRGPHAPRGRPPCRAPGDGRRSRPGGPRSPPGRPPPAVADAGAGCSGAATGAWRARGSTRGGRTAAGSGRAGSGYRRRAPCRPRWVLGRASASASPYDGFPRFTPCQPSLEPREDAMATEAQVREALRSVLDPEIGRPIEDIGMLRGISIEGDTVRVDVLITIEGCPLKDRITNDVTAAVQPLEGVDARGGRPVPHVAGAARGARPTAPWRRRGRAAGAVEDLVPRRRPRSSRSRRARAAWASRASR